MPVKLHSHSGDEGDEARIEIIPLIDIMFFLLAAFMLVSLSMTHMRRLPLELARSTTSVVQSDSPPVQIAIDASGIMTWERQVVSPTEITDRLKTLGGAAVEVMISADGNALHKHVLAAMDAVRQAGVERVNFETRE
ncbi:MAG TPA: biopolymer transporter ExbD [Luteolibacter sp.]|nr:biopolymer transporter ExbD [Luteolibacter sp.]